MSSAVAPYLGVLIHALHYALVFGGMVGVGVIIGCSHPSIRKSRRAAAPRTVHEQRVCELRFAMSQGGSGLATVATMPRPVTRVSAPGPAVGRESSGTVLPVALVCSTAAAGVHAAVGPAHFEEGLAIGTFFLVAALVQLGWSAQLLAWGPTPKLLQIGVALNVGILALWALTRTVGLPFGLAPVEQVGPWDSAALVFELAVAVTCLLALRRGGTVTVRELRNLWTWSFFAQLSMVASVGALAWLTLVGASA